MNGCGTTVEVPIARGYDVRMIERTCGKWYGGEQLLCDRCVSAEEMRYPQGWRYRPGNVCRHGVYVGGVGVDYMCGRCEMGDA